MKEVKSIITNSRNTIASLIMIGTLVGCSPTEQKTNTSETASTDETASETQAEMAQNKAIDKWMESANFILGIYYPEDIIQIPGTKWILATGLTSQGPGMGYKYTKKNYLHLLNAETETGGPITGDQYKMEPDLKRFPDAKTPPDWEVFGPHGIGVGTQDGDKVTLYVVNHGGRESVEIFEVNVAKSTPQFTWIGSVLGPEDGFLDAVAWIPGTDGFMATAITNPLDPNAGKEQAKGEAVGWVRSWNLADGWKTVLGTELDSAPNGVIVSEDGKQVFVAASGNFSVYKITMNNGKAEIATAKLEGFPDNVRWSSDGKSILVGVHTEDLEKFMEASVYAVKTSGVMMTKFNISRINPETMETEIVMPSGVYGAFGAGTGAIEVGDRLWVSSTGSDRIGIFDLKP